MKKNEIIVHGRKKASIKRVSIIALLFAVATGVSYGKMNQNLSDIKISTFDGRICQSLIVYHVTKKEILIKLDNTPIAAVSDDLELYRKIKSSYGALQSIKSNREKLSAAQKCMVLDGGGITIISNGDRDTLGLSDADFACNTSKKTKALEQLYNEIWKFTRRTKDSLAKTDQRLKESCDNYWRANRNIN